MTSAPAAISPKDADPLAAMNGNLFPLLQVEDQLSQERDRDCGGIRHSAVGNWEMDEAKTFGFGHLGLFP